MESSRLSVASGQVAACAGSPEEILNCGKGEELVARTVEATISD